MILHPTAPVLHLLAPPRSSRPSPHFVVLPPSCRQSTISGFPSHPSSSHPFLLCSYRKTVFQHHQHYCKEFGSSGGLKKNTTWTESNADFGLRAGRVPEESRRTKKKGLEFGLETKGLRRGGVGVCNSSLKEEDSLRNEQQQPSSTSSNTVAVSLAGENSDCSMEGKSLWSKLGQNLNLSGVFFSARVIVKDRRLAIPHVSVPDISWIDWKALRSKGFQGVLFDKDNTLTAPYGQNIWPPLTDSLEECREVFGGRIALLSNSAGLYQYDPLGAEAKLLENRLGIPVIRHGQKKPAGNALVLSDYFGCDPAMLIMVGDRYFTDVVYGNNNGLLTIRPAPLTTRGDPFMVRKVRVLEETLVDWWRREGYRPPNHHLYDDPVDFIKDPGCW